MNSDWFSNYTENPRVRQTESLEEAIEVVEEETEGQIDLDNIVSMRGTIISVDESYQIPGSDNLEENETSDSDSYLDPSVIEPRGTSEPDRMADIDEALEWGSEKGPETEWIRTAGYAGEMANIDHCWSAMDSAPYNLDKWNVPEKDQEKTRPVLFVYDDEFIDQDRGGYDTGLPDDPEERSQAIDYAVVVDQNPTSDDFGI